VTCEAYRGVAFRYGSLSALLGVFFSWLLSFPLLGPSLYAFAETRGIDATDIGVAFLLFHGLGLIAYGIWGRRYLIGLSRKLPGKGEIRLTDNITGENAIDVLVMGLSCGCRARGDSRRNSLRGQASPSAFLCVFGCLNSIYLYNRRVCP
jgi:hypothetical protein